MSGWLQPHGASQEAREDSVDIGGVAPDRSAGRQCDPHGRRLGARLRRLDERRPAPQQARPQPRVLAAHHFASLRVDERVGAVAHETTFGHVGRLDLLAPHGLDRESPQRLDGTDSLTHGSYPSRVNRHSILNPAAGVRQRLRQRERSREADSCEPPQACGDSCEPKAPHALPATAGNADAATEQPHAHRRTMRQIGASGSFAITAVRAQIDRSGARQFGRRYATIAGPGAALRPSAGELDPSSGASSCRR
jgi:hypothetical protein